MKGLSPENTSGASGVRSIVTASSDVIKQQNTCGYVC